MYLQKGMDSQTKVKVSKQIFSQCLGWEGSPKSCVQENIQWFMSISEIMCEYKE